MTTSSRVPRYSSLSSKFPAAISALALSAAPAAFAANAAWNTDAVSGNFNTAQWTSGVTVPVAAGTYTVLSGDSLYFGTQTTGATALTNDLTGASFAGLTFNASASAFTIGGNSFTLTGNIVNNSTGTQTINNAIAISGARTINAASGQLILGGNLTGTPGTTTLSGNNKITLGGTNNLTLSANFGGLIINGAGGVDITGATTINGAAGNTFSGYMNVNGNTTLTVQSGGSLAINGTSNGSKPDSGIGNNVAGTSTILVNGGSLTYGGEQGLMIGNNRADATGVLTISSGTATITAGSTTATDIRSYIAIGRDLANGTINLNGGTLATSRNFVRDGGGASANGGTANFVFGGGTLKALANQADWLNSSLKNTNQQALSSVTTISANSTIDSNGFTVAINSNISGAGGFNIISSSGNGIVIFGGTNTYTGDTKVLSGTFQLGLNSATANFLADSTSLYLTTGSLLNLSFTSNAVTESVAGLYIDGVQQASGTWGAIGSGANFEISLITGTGVLNVSAVPEPSTYAAIFGGLALAGAVVRRRCHIAAPAV